MALFAKSNTPANTTVFSKEIYKITDKRTLSEPTYVVDGANMPQVIAEIADGEGCYLCIKNNCKLYQLARGDIKKAKNGTYKCAGHYDKMAPGFCGEQIIPGNYFNNGNDVIVLGFFFDGSIQKDSVGRPDDGVMLVAIDAADYANLDVKEFVYRVDAEIKQKPVGTLLLGYPIAWRAKDIVYNSNIQNFCEVKKASDFPSIVPYDKAIKTKDGNTVVGKIKTTTASATIEKTRVTTNTPAPTKQTIKDDEQTKQRKAAAQKRLNEIMKEIQKLNEEKAILEEELMNSSSRRI